ncbi:MAG: hypothetical protein H0T79_10430 [Deltaproteobacteria bacterium]|nr:hypothetical protein [Deltaproteobacteria bacterium]
MAICLRDYDLAAATRRLQDRVSKERGIVVDRDGRVDYGNTQQLRTLTGVGGALEHVGWALLEILNTLDPAEGGVMTVEELTPDRPIVQALMIVRSHPSHPGFGHVLFPRGRPLHAGWKNSPLDAGPVLDRLHAQHGGTWDLAALRQLIFDAACSLYGDLLVDADATPNEIQPGSMMSYYLTIFRHLALYDAVGAFAPSFTRQDALVGEWWLCQPVSPRLDHRALALELGLQLAGFLPQSVVDKGRVVMACYERSQMTDASRAENLADSKFVAGWQKVTWRRDQPPLTDPRFDLVPEVEGVTPTSYGPYRHSSELPAWPKGT